MPSAGSAARFGAHGKYSWKVCIQGNVQMLFLINLLVFSLVLVSECSFFSICTCTYHSRFWSHECEYVYIYTVPLQSLLIAQHPLRSCEMWAEQSTECAALALSVQSEHTHSLSPSLTHFHARSLIFVSTLPPTLSSPLPAPLHCYTWHNGPIIVPSSLSVTSAHSALIQKVFVFGPHVKIASIHTCMSKTVCFCMTKRVFPVIKVMVLPTYWPIHKILVVFQPLIKIILLSWFMSFYHTGF